MTVVGIDIENPPQVRYLLPCARAFERAGCNAILYGSTVALLDSEGARFTTIGGRFGKSRAQKILGVARRARRRAADLVRRAEGRSLVRRSRHRLRRRQPLRGRSREHARPLRPPAEESHYHRSASREVALSLLRYLARREAVVVVHSPRYPWQERYLSEIDWLRPRSSFVSRYSLSPS